MEVCNKYKRHWVILMVIIFEGVDNSGKDTQIRLIKKHLLTLPTHVLSYSDIKGISSTLHKDILKKQYEDGVQIIKESIKKRNLIFNRFLFGENIYSFKYRGYDGGYIFNIEKNLLKHQDDTYLIVFVDNEKNLLKREDGLSFSKNLKDKKYEVEKFKETYNKSKIKNKILINIENKKIEDVYEEVRNFLKNHKDFT